MPQEKKKTWYDEDKWRIQYESLQGSKGNAYKYSELYNNIKEFEYNNARAQIQIIKLKKKKMISQISRNSQNTSKLIKKNYGNKE